VKKIENKNRLENKGFFAMFSGYSDNHPSNPYLCVILKAGKVTISQWLNKTWSDFKGNKSKSKEYTENIKRKNFNDKFDRVPIYEEDDSDDKHTGIVTHSTTTKLQQKLARLKTRHNDVVPTETIELASIMVTQSGPADPNTIKKVWDHCNQESQMRWREATNKKFNYMISKGVWKFCKILDLPSESKTNGTVVSGYLIALGYSQIPGVDYTDNFASIAHDITYCLIILQKIIHLYEAEIVNVETAFLYGNLHEKIHIKIPEGLHTHANVSKDDCS
jgi:hypothetical protein